MSKNTLPEPQTSEKVKSVNNYQALKGIQCIDPLTHEDEETLFMVRDILEKRGAINRFGVNLLRHPFRVDENEILVETTDEDTRTQTITPLTKQELQAIQGGDEMMITNFRFEPEHTGLVPSMACLWDGKNHWPLL